LNRDQLFSRLEHRTGNTADIKMTDDGFQAITDCLQNGRQMPNCTMAAMGMQKRCASQVAGLGGSEWVRIRMRKGADKE